MRQFKCGTASDTDSNTDTDTATDTASVTVTAVADTVAVARADSGWKTTSATRRHASIICVNVEAYRRGTWRRQQFAQFK